MDPKNKSTLNANQQTTIHLYNLCHSLPTNPINQSYFNKLLDHCNEKNINLPDSIINGARFCDSCGTILVPGWNLTQRVVYQKGPSRGKRKAQKVTGNTNKSEEQDWSPRTRKLRSSCLHCGEFSDVDLLVPSKGTITATQDASKTKATQFKAEWPESIYNSSSKRQQEEKSNAKKRAKKRKQNTLTNLLNQKKENDANETKRNSLNLMEFMMK